MDYFKRFLLGTSVAAGIIVAGTLTANAALVITVTSDAGGGEAAAAEAAYLAGLSSSTNESFEGFTAADFQTSFNTAVGTFTKSGADGTGLCTNCGKLAILDAATSPFDGRYPQDGSNWLDSNDNGNASWAVALAGSASFDSIGWYMTDVSDQGGTLTITFDSCDIEIVQLSALADGNLMFIEAAISSSVTSATVTFANDSTGDGWGIDDITVGLTGSGGGGQEEVPEPAMLGLLGLGLAGIGLIRRRRKAA